MTVLYHGNHVFDHLRAKEALIGSAAVVPDYVIYQDKSGYKAIRMWDARILYSSATSTSDVINDLLASLTLTYPGGVGGYADRWSPTNLTGWKRGLVIKNIVPWGVYDKAVVIPPLQDCLVDMSGINIMAAANMTSLITIDSMMNAHIRLGVLSVMPASYGPTFPTPTVSNLVYVNPHTVGPDSQTLILVSTIRIEALFGNVDKGLYVDYGAASITGNEFVIVEGNTLGAAQKGTIIYVKNNTTADTGAYSNHFQIIGITAAESALNIEAGTQVFGNRFVVPLQPLEFGDGGWETMNPPIVVTAAVGVQNTIETLPQPQARVYNSAAQAILNDTQTALTFDTEDYDAWTMHSTESNTGRLTVAVPGLYLINGTAAFVNNATGVRDVLLVKNGNVNLASASMGRRSDNYWIGNVSTTEYLVKDDYITLEVYQDSGDSLNTHVEANRFPVLTATRLR